ncbi:MAG: ASKHA domain-containing protein [Oscillospiraceae bacterium]|jgi:uncharacterized 2Fe-2S/4Fe-4S cluster protein (DUF4445 family)|nr:ASKHA domain-containing protein [Oscillospiraceae bacterium]
MPPTIKIYRSGKLVCETDGIPGETLLARISAAGMFLDAPCGGQGKCGKCLIRLSPTGKQILACRTAIDGDADVYLPDEMEMKIADAGTGASPYHIAATPEEEKPPQPPSAPSIPLARPGDSRLGVAVDIGTTTVVAHLTDIATGTRIATASGVNAQRPYGADVISRIQYCVENGHETLTRLIREQLSKLIRNTCAASGARSEDIAYISIAANTIMEHLAARYSPVGMGVVPFTPVSLFGDELEVGDDLPVAKNAKVYFAPAISSYVGGDITAGMLAAGLESEDGPVVYLDIGTNGEIVLKSGNKYFCCATAAGPAFEGAEISMGMAAIRGAVNHVKWDGGLKLSVIGEAQPLGLCGSGLLDALAVLLETGAVDETGRLLNTNDIDHEIAEHIEKFNGENIFRLAKESPVYMSASDIRKLQLAKSAIAAGIQTLLRRTGTNEDQVKRFVLAGGFGSFMDQCSAARIGLFPKSFLPVAKTMGNTAGEGAALALCSADARAALDSIRNRCEYIELPTSPVFNEQFVEQMMF